MRALATLFAAAAAAACVTTAPRVAGDSTAEPADDAAYRALVALLARNPATGASVDSVAELVPLLDEDLRSSFTLVYATRSPQPDVDPVHPRALLFGRDARLIIAYTGDPAGAHRDVLEVLHFRDASRAFELERFVLPAAARRDPELAALAAENGHANPAACRRCHGGDPRPIFDSYAVWPGVYGSVRDRLARGSAELAGYRAFLAAKDAPASVYRALVFPAGSEVSPYALEPGPGDPPDETGDDTPNLRFGMALAELGRKRIARKLQASPRYGDLRDKLLAGLLGCEALPITDDDRARVGMVLAAENSAKLDRAGITDPARRDELRMAELDSAENLVELDAVARVLDTSRADWSFALEPAAGALYDGILSGRVEAGVGLDVRDFYLKEDVLLELLGALAATDRAVARRFATRPYVLHDRFGTRLDLPRAIAACGVLADRARGVPWPALFPAPPPVTARCIRCHEPGGEAPPIPFASPRALRALLAARPELAATIADRTATADEPRRMPLAAPPLAAADRADLDAYVGGLDVPSAERRTWTDGAPP